MDDDARIYPITHPVCHAAPGAGEHEGHIVFVTPGENPVIATQNVDVIWEVLLYCTGRVSITTVCEQMQADSRLARTIIHSLMDCGVLVDANQQVEALQGLTDSPPLFPATITDQGIAELTRTPDLGLQEGRVVRKFGSLQDSPLSQLLMRRKSVRQYSPEGVSAEQLETLFMLMYSLVYRTTASAGGLNVLRIYFMLTRDQADLPAGLYQYDPQKHQVIALADLPHEHEIAFALNNDTTLYGAPVIVVIGMSPTRHSKKYANRGWRYSHFEAGGAQQNLVLSALHVGLDSLVYGGINDAAISQLFGMDPAKTRPLIAVAVGHESQQPLSPDAAAMATELQAALSTLAPCRRAGVCAEPYGGYQARVVLAEGEDGETVGTGAAASSEAAFVKAFAEAWERYAIVSFNRVDRICPAAELDGPWMDPRFVMPLSPEQFAARPELAPFDPTAPWEWVEGKTWDGRRTVYVPLDLATYTKPSWLARKFCVNNNSSGVAVHTSYEEAARRGLLELLERDAFMRHWLSGQAPTRIAHQHLPAFLRRRVLQLQRQGKEVEVLNFSRGAYGAAAIAVVIHGESFPSFMLGMSASDTDWQAAAIKAFSEADLTHGRPTEPPTELIEPQGVWSPADHGELYWQSAFADQVSWLWQGPYGPPPTVNPISEAIDVLAPVVVELGRVGTLVATRVLSMQLVPIGFGFGMDHHLHAALKGRVEDRPYLPIPFA